MHCHLLDKSSQIGRKDKILPAQLPQKGQIFPALSLQPDAILQTPQENSQPLPDDRRIHALQLHDFRGRFGGLHQPCLRQQVIADILKTCRFQPCHQALRGLPALHRQKPDILVKRCRHQLGKLIPGKGTGAHMVKMPLHEVFQHAPVADIGKAQQQIARRLQIEPQPRGNILGITCLGKPILRQDIIKKFFFQGQLLGKIIRKYPMDIQPLSASLDGHIFIIS